MQKRRKRWGDYGMLIRFGVIAFFVIASSMAVGSPQHGEETPSWLEHWDIVRVMISALFLITGWFLVRTLTKIDKNQDALFGRLREAEEKIAELKGRCDVLACKD